MEELFTWTYNEKEFEKKLGDDMDEIVKEAEENEKQIMENEKKIMEKEKRIMENEEELEVMRNERKPFPFSKNGCEKCGRERRLYTECEYCEGH